MAKNNANRYQLSRKLRRYEKTVVIRNGEKKEIEVAKEFLKPWQSFTYDAHAFLCKIIVSFKQNLRVINKTTNKYESYYDANGKLNTGKNGLPIKQLVAQSTGDSWGIRKPMHKDTVFGKVNLRKIRDVKLSVAIQNPTIIVNSDLKEKIKELLLKGFDQKLMNNYFKENKDIWSDVNLNKISTYYFSNETNDKFYATRKLLDQSFSKAKIESSVTDTGIQKILLRHLEQNQNNAEIAFSPDGIDELNRNIVKLNNGKFHQPIYKVRCYEKADKYSIGNFGNKKAKYVEAAKGTNLYFAIYWNEAKQKREFETIPLNITIEHQKLVAHLPKTERTPVPVNKEKGIFLFVLSPNDLVYVPTQEEMENPSLFDKDRLTADQVNRLYKMVSSSGSQCFFIQNHVSNTIVNKVEFSALNKMEKTIDGLMVKEICWKLNVDRLGYIVSAMNGQR